MTAAYDSHLTAGRASLQNLTGDAGETSLSHARWNEAAVQISTYFHAFGIDDEEDLNRLARQVLQRIAAKVEAQTSEQLPRPAIEEAQQMLNEWLVTVLGLQDTHQFQTLAAARAALRFCKETAHWPDGFLQTDAIPAELREALQTVTLQPVPAPRELLMETQPIDFWHPLTSTGRGLRQFLKQLAKALFKHLH